MDISTSQPSIQPTITSSKVASLPDTLLSNSNLSNTSLSNTPLNVPSVAGNNNQSVAPSVSTSGDAPVNPTYAKPIPSSGPVNEGENLSPKDEHNVSPDENKVTEAISNKEKPDAQQQGAQEIYSDEELVLISALKSRDAEVNAHEKAHAAVGGQHAGAPNYSYKTGPDGVKYAVSGEVSIDTSRVPGDPQATLQKAQQIKAAALAPAEPSGQDRKVAAIADQMASEARSDILAGSHDRDNNVAHSHSNNSAPEHFTKPRSLAINNNIDNETQIQMRERSFHIRALYQSSANSTATSNFETYA